MELESEPHSCAHVNVCVITVINVSCWLLTFFVKYFIYIFIWLHQVFTAFELWCWRRFLRVSRMARRSNQSILKEISPEYSLEGLMLKLKL